MSYAVSAAAATNISLQQQQPAEADSFRLFTVTAAATTASWQQQQQQQQQRLQQTATTALAAACSNGSSLQQQQQQPKRVPFQHFPGFLRDVGEGAEQVLVKEGAAVDLAVGAEEDLEGIQPAAGQRHQLACNTTAYTERLSS